MADSSILTLGTARSLLVDSSVCDSRIAETTKDHLFLGMACEDGEGSCLWPCPLCNVESSLNLRARWHLFDINDMNLTI